MADGFPGVGRAENLNSMFPELRSIEPTILRGRKTRTRRPGPSDREKQSVPHMIEESLHVLVVDDSAMVGQAMHLGTEPQECNI